MVKQQEGMSLIEVIVFILVMGIASVGVLTGLNQVLSGASKPEGLLQASFLANARMEVIRAQRAQVGYALVSDPCASGAVAICNPLSSFASANGFTVNSSISTAGSKKNVSVQVNGISKGRVDSQMSNY